MPKVAKTDSKPAAAGLGANKVSFEKALSQLEEIVDAMETGELPLEELLTRFEEGSRLTQICQEKLDEAELKIQKLEKTASGEVRAIDADLPEDLE